MLMKDRITFCQQLGSMDVNVGVSACWSTALVLAEISH